MTEKLFLGFGIIALISGILLILQKQYVIGTAGSIVGAGLALQNMKKIKDRNRQKDL